MHRFMLFLLVIIMCPAVLYAEPELTGSPAELAKYLSSLPREVTITGEAKLKIQSKSGVVTIGIKTENSKLQNALQNNQRLRDELVNKLVKQGIAATKIRGTKFSSVPEYGFFGKKPNNYVVDNILNIAVENEEEIHKVAELVDNYKEVFYQGIELKEQKREELKLQLLKIALTDAKIRQKIYEEDLGVVLKAIGFEENISFEKTPTRPRSMRKSKKSYGSSEIEDIYRDDLTLGEHIYQGFVKIRYHVLADKPIPEKPENKIED